MTEKYDGQTPEQRSPVGRLMRFCLANRLVVALIVLGVVAAGVLTAPFDWELWGLPRSPVPTDAIPDIGENQQVVFTEWMGRSPKDVDDQISYPLTTALLGMPGVRTIRSYSMFGFSTVYVIFEEKVGFYWSRSRVLEKLNSLPAGTLPPGVQPALGPDATALGQIFWYTLEGRDPGGNPAGGWDLEELRTIQDWQVRHSLLAAGGVAEAAGVGGFVREYQVDVDPDAMRAHGVTLAEVHEAVKASNIDVGAGTIEANRVEYFIRGVGFIKSVGDIENSVIKARGNVPITVRQVATVTAGPALRRGALDKEGAEAVGGVVVARFGSNPLAVIRNVKHAIERLAPGLPTKVLIDPASVVPGDPGAAPAEVRRHVALYAEQNGFDAYAAAGGPDHPAWVKHLRGLPRDQWPVWVNTSQVTVVPFYDRTGLIHETLGTLNDALAQEILITFVVVIIMAAHLRSSVLIGSMLPLAVLLCFIAMRVFGVDANIVALSGIAIAIGTIVDMGIVICENILRHLDEAPAGAPRLEVVHRAASEVGGAVLTAVATTVVGFLPVFTMTGPEGRLFRPLAFTKTFALLASIVIALTVIPPAAHVLFTGRISGKKLRAGLYLALGAAGLWLVRRGLVRESNLIAASGGALTLFAAYSAFQGRIPARLRRLGPWAASAVVVVLVGWLLSAEWEPLGPQRGLWRNFVFVGGLVAGLLGLFRLFQFVYPRVLRWCLAHKLLFLSAPAMVIAAGIAGVWLGPGAFLGQIPEEYAARTFTPQELEEMTALQRYKHAMARLKDRQWADPSDPPARRIANQPGSTKIKWTLARGWDGLGREFMPPLDEGSYLYMPTTMTHASIGEAMDVLAKQDVAFRAIPEIDSVVGKIGRAETPLDPAPISMIETVINYKSEYKTDKDGRRETFRVDPATGDFIYDKAGRLIPDPDGQPFRQWRPWIKSPDDIWAEIVKAGEVPGTTSAPRLQPIAARIVMLQSGMRAPMGIKVSGPDLETIERVGIQLEALLKQAPGVEPSAVIADRIVGKPYWEIVPLRKAMDRYGVTMRQFQDVVEIAIGGRLVTTTVEGRERFGVRVRYARELRDSREGLGRILVPGEDGAQVPLEQIAEIVYVRGPQMIKSEDTRLTGYVLFDKQPGRAEVDVVEACRRFLAEKEESGEFLRPAGVEITFAGSYENQVRAQKTLIIVLPAALFLIFLVLYFQFKAVPTTLLVFFGILVAWAGGFLLIWLYAQPWFLDISIFDVNMRELFQVHTVNLSVAVWVGFLALFGIASDDGVVMGTYLEQSFASRPAGSVGEVRAAVVAAGARRVRPCLMTTATTILALLPVLTSTGRGSDIMVPMAIPSFGGMLIEVMTMLIVPVLYCLVKEFRHHSGWGDGAVGVMLLLTAGLAVVPMGIYCWVKGLSAKAPPAAETAAEAP